MPAATHHVNQASTSSRRLEAAGDIRQFKQSAIEISSIGKVCVYMLSTHGHRLRCC